MAKIRNSFWTKNYKFWPKWSPVALVKLLLWFFLRFFPDKKTIILCFFFLFCSDFLWHFSWWFMKDTISCNFLSDVVHLTWLWIKLTKKTRIQFGTWRQPQTTDAQRTWPAVNVAREIEQRCFNSTPDWLFWHKFLIQLLLVVLK